MSASVAGQLAAFITRQSIGDLPERAIDYAAMLISSTIASAAAGLSLEPSRIMRALELDGGQGHEASLWFEGNPKTGVAGAARVNAIMSDAAASDDSDLRNIIHPGTTLVASSLAVAEKAGSSGAEILAAIVLGYEAMGRINCAGIPGVRERGFHGCVIAVFGGAVATARLLRLDSERTTHAIALAATSIGGIMSSARVSFAREYHAGLAAMLGVQAAQAAGAGLKADPGVLEHPAGYFHVYGEGPPADIIERVTGGLGERWEILTEMGIKLVPGGHPFHSLAEAAAAAARDGNVDPAAVETITMCQPGVTRLPGARHPTDMLSMAQSAAYFLAAGTADRDFSWPHATATKINDPVIRRLLDTVQVGPPPSEDASRYKQGATVTIRMRDGREITRTVFAPRGSAILGIDWADVDAKFRALAPAAGLSSNAIESAIPIIHGFRHVSNVAELTGLLR